MVRITKIEERATKKGATYLLVHFSDGGKAGAFSPELFQVIRDNINKEVEVDVSVNGNYHTINSVNGIRGGGGGGAVPHPATSHTAPQQPKPDWDKINEQKNKEIAIAICFKESCRLVATHPAFKTLDNEEVIARKVRETAEVLMTAFNDFKVTGG